MKFVKESDGCDVDCEDLVEMAAFADALMVLTGPDQKWTKVSTWMLSDIVSHY